MPRITIDNLQPYDGQYDVPPELTLRELHTIKRISGLRPNEFGEAFDKGDTDIVLALALIGLERAGHIVNEDMLWDSQTGRIRIDFSVDDDAGPPPKTGDAAGEKPSEPNASSGASGNGTGDTPPASDQSSTGTPPSAATATSESTPSAS